MATYFEYAYDLCSAFPVIVPFPIASATAIELGEVVKLSAGFVVAVGDQDQDDPYLGVAQEPHDGSTSGRQSGTVIKVYCSPTAVFKTKPPSVVADSGNTTTIVDASYGTIANDEMNGGALKLVSLGTSSTLTLAPGKVVTVTDFVTSTGTFTGTFTGGTTAGDTYKLFPPVGAHSFDLNSDGTNFDFNSTGGESLEIVQNDFVNEWIYFKLRLHQLASYPVAL